jgi:hypothetical protein
MSSFSNAAVPSLEADDARPSGRNTTGTASVSGPAPYRRYPQIAARQSNATELGCSVDRMADETPDPDLTADEELMLEIGWLDLWHADREYSRGDDAG